MAAITQDGRRKGDETSWNPALRPDTIDLDSGLGLSGAAGTASKAHDDRAEDFPINPKGQGLDISNHQLNASRDQESRPRHKKATLSIDSTKSLDNQLLNETRGHTDTKTPNTAIPIKRAVNGGHSVKSMDGYGMDGSSSPIDHSDDFSERLDPAWGFSPDMPSFNHTNSFPEVPTLPRKTVEDTHPLPQSQVEEVIHTVDDALGDTIEAGESARWDNWQVGTSEANAEEQGFSVNQGTMGMDHVPTTPMDEESRYEEGLPLVLGSDDAVVLEGKVQPEIETQPPNLDFGQGADDSFFEDLSKPTQGKNAVQRIDRKSTFDAIAAAKSTNAIPSGGTNDLVEADDGSSSSEEPTKESGLGFSTSDAVASKKGSSVQGPPMEEDLAAKWKDLLDDDELLEDEPELDTGAFFEDDGKGFLEDGETEDAPQIQQDTPQQLQGQAPSRPSVQQWVGQPAVTGNAKAPSNQGRHYTPLGFSNPSSAGISSPQYGYSRQIPSRPTIIGKAESFVDKSKGGYSSPYDLPMEFTRPKRKTTTESVPSPGMRGTPPVQAPPPRSSSIQSNPMLQQQIYTPPSSNPSNSPQFDLGNAPGGSIPPRPQARAGSGSFFEELPSSARARPASTVNRFTPVLPQQGPPLQAGPPRPTPPSSAPHNPSSTSFGLVGPEKVMPFSDSPSSMAPLPATSTPNTRYSPSPSTSQPQPPSQGRYAAVPGTTSGPPPRAPSVSQIPFRPHTSSPLARSSSASQQYRPGGQPSEPSTDTPSQTTQGARRTSIKALQQHEQAALEESPQKPLSSQQPRGVPPRNINLHHPLEQSQIMSPEAHQSGGLNMNLPTQGPPTIHPTQPELERPKVQPRTSLPAQSVQRSIEHYSASKQEITSQNEAAGLTLSANANQNLILPVDGRELDPLARWRGAPIFSFGFGGTNITFFPQHIPRYGPGQMVPMVKCAPGEIKIHTAKILPLDEQLLDFPGPLKSKGKKKEVLEWLKKSIQRLEQQQHQQLPVLGPSSVSSEDLRKRQGEKILLWKIVHTFVNCDGALESNKDAMDTIRKELTPEFASDISIPGTTSQNNMQPLISQPSFSADSTVSSGSVALDQLRQFLFRGEREKAVWHAVDHKLWGHAMMIASTLPREIWKQLTQEFVRHEIRRASSDNTKPLAALYTIFAGSWEESVDQLVPPSARAGLQLLSRSSTGGSSNNALNGLDRWRETLCMILSNRSTEDVKSILALGRLLLSYGRVEAAHVCFLFAGGPSLFSGPDDQQGAIALLGWDHRQTSLDLSRDLDCLLLTEVYEYAYGPLSSSLMSNLMPHLQAFKLHHAQLLAEHGRRDEALQYCDTIGGVLKATTKGSPYFHGRLFSALDDLASRLRDAPKDSSGSWISRPSMDKVSGSLWNKLDKFISGDDDASSVASGKAGDGPFAGISSGTPTISRGPSPSENYNAYNSTGAYVPVAASVAQSNSRYAPAGQHTSQSSSDNLQALNQRGHKMSSLRNQHSASPQNRSIAAGTFSPPGLDRYAPTPSTQPGSSPETHAKEASNRELPALAKQLPPSFNTPSQNLDLQGSSVLQSPPPNNSQRLSPYEPQSASYQLSPKMDRSSPLYEPRTATYAPRSASYEPRSASYEPRSSSNEPHSYQPSPNREESQEPEPSSLDHSAPYEPKVPSIEPESLDSLSQEPPGPSHEVIVSTEGKGKEKAIETPKESSSSYQPPSFGDQPPSSAYEPPTSDYQPSSSEYQPPTSGYEPPGFSYQPPDLETTNEESTNSAGTPMERRSIMDDVDEDDASFQRRVQAIRSEDQGRAEQEDRAARDRAADDAFRRAALEDSQRQRPEASSSRSSGWGLGSLFRRSRTPAEADTHTPGKPIKAKLGEENQFYYDEDLKRWVNKKGGLEETKPTAPPPPPPRGRVVSAPGGPPRPSSAQDVPPVPPLPGVAGPSSNSTLAPPMPSSASVSTLAPPPSLAGLVGGGGGGSSSGPVAGSAPASRPASRPGTGISTTSNASSIDDLLGAPQARKGGTVKKAKKGRVDVLAK